MWIIFKNEFRCRITKVKAHRQSVPPTSAGQWLLSASLLFGLVAALQAFGDDETALLAAIQQHPEEDTPRLVYADWLQEHRGDAGAVRAEFIRLQIELANRKDIHSADFRTTQERVNKLLADNFQAWTPSVFQHERAEPAAINHRVYPTSEGQSVQWRRGFIDNVVVSDEQLASKELRDAIDHLPGLTGLEVMGHMNQSNVAQPFDVSHLLKLKALKRITDLDFRGMVTDEGLAQVLDATGKLKLLFLNSAGITPAGITTLLSSKHAKTLVGLSLLESRTEGGSVNFEAMVTQIVTSRKLPRLETLALHFRPLLITNPILDGLNDLDNLPSLRNLHVSSMTNVNLRHLVRSPRFGTLSQFKADMLGETQALATLLHSMAVHGKNLIHVEIGEMGPNHHFGPRELSTVLNDALRLNRVRLSCFEFLNAFVNR